MGGQRPPFLPYSDVQTKEAGNKDDNYHYADDVENIHDVPDLFDSVAV
jgi:hypothetical protein